MPGILSKLSPFENKRQVIIHNQSVGDIITGILQTHSKYTADYDRIADRFSGRNAEEIARNVFNYLKENTHYKIEKDSAQTLRSPAAIIALGSNPRIGLDCKSYALFIAGILSAYQRRGMNINWCYRFASYKMLDKLPHHVFVVINPGTNNEIFVDPVLPSFNYQKSYTYKIDRKPMLVSISGIGRTKRTADEKKKRRQEIKEKIKTQIKKKGKLILKVNPGTVTARNSFLLLVKLNVFNLGRRLYELQLKDPGKLQKFWESIGGNYRTLSINIGLGAKKQPQLSGAVGFAPAVAAAIASATPIVISIKKLLDSAGIKSDDVKKLGGALIKKAIEKKIDAKADEIASEEEGEEPMDQDSADDINIPESATEALDSGDDMGGPIKFPGLEEARKYAASKRPGGNRPINPWLLGGAALVGAYFLIKK